MQNIDIEGKRKETTTKYDKKRKHLKSGEKHEMNNNLSGERQC